MTLSMFYRQFQNRVVNPRHRINVNKKKLRKIQTRRFSNLLGGIPPPDDSFTIISLITASLLYFYNNMSK
jgi:hypothetical protein